LDSSSSPESDASPKPSSSSSLPTKKGGNVEQPKPYSESEKLVGIWQASEIEFGQRIKILWQVQSDGTYYFRDFQSAGTHDHFGTWRYSNGMTFENSSNGSSETRGSVKWLSDNHFELTILDNGVPAYTGIKRNYYRQ
jgi:hypothetical protein